MEAKQLSTQPTNSNIMFRYSVRMSRNGKGFNYECIAATSYEAKETAERFYPDCHSINATRIGKA